jgi:hypothetical protein
MQLKFIGELTILIATVIFFQFEVNELNNELHRLRDIIKDARTFEEVGEVLRKHGDVVHKEIDALVKENFLALIVTCIMSYSGLVKQLLGRIYSRLTFRQFKLDHTHIIEWTNAIFTTVWLYKSLIYAFEKNDGFNLSIHLKEDQRTGMSSLGKQRQIEPEKSSHGRHLDDHLNEDPTI